MLCKYDETCNEVVAMEMEMGLGVLDDDDPVIVLQYSRRLTC